ncbi:cellulose binding domain-containing protein [Streptomyces sp. NPDC058794]|uniref:cellulose binding domain-containing protein n=1 Tax=unclassified Streptomyces TaxID=2593676 RepID=UPI00368A32F3
MSDPPSPQDAAEAALFAECWDTVLSYARLCTAGSPEAVRLATEAFGHGMREVRAADAAVARSAARSPSRLPRVPLLLTAVRATAAAWETAGRGHGLDPGLRLWLNSARAARYTGPPPRRPLALRGLKDMQAPDAELLWLADVEALPPSVVARRLGLDPATVSGELARARELFRDRCRRGHLDATPDTGCRAYARLLDAVTRSPAADVPEDLSHHLATCPDCAEAAGCLRPHGAGLPAALAAGVIGWGGLAYLEHRRRAAEARLGAAHPAADDDHSDRAADAGHRARVVRGGLLGTAVAVSLLALTVSLHPFGTTAEDSAAPTATAVPTGTVDRRPAAVPGSAPATEATEPPEASLSPAEDPAAAPDRPPQSENPDPEPQGTATPTTPATPTARADGPAEPGRAPSPCRVRYDLVNQWPDGFQATVTVTTGSALDSWQVAWTFPDGQRVERMWDARQVQEGARVTAGAADYNKAVPAGGRIALGFVASWRGRNSPPYAFTLNGRECERA